MNYYVKIYSVKPKEDINRFVESIGYVPVMPDIKRRGGVAHFLIKTLMLFYILKRLHKGDLLLIQYPYKKFYTLTCNVAHWKGAKVITLIHDLGSFRRKKLTPKKENWMLMHTDYLICHNEAMLDFLVEQGFTQFIDTLQIFDYLAASPIPRSKERHTPWQVTFAGGLGYGRSPFIYHLDDSIKTWELQLYGKHFDQERAQGWKHIHYNGLFTPEQLINEVEGDFGLVWDGDSLDQCSGNWGEYLLINNPHKASFTLRMGLPVIIWSKAALAPFILEHGVGLCIDSLRDLNDVLDNLSEEEYNKMRHNAELMSEKIGTGYFTHRALHEAEKCLLGNEK
ncbi:MAG: galactofuranosyltransferase [Bacteroidales bacterium]|nr:galactofuranosyltransferase [Bacteroidales bacterium]